MQHSSQKGGKVGLLDAGAEQALRRGQLAEAIGKQGQQVVLIVRPRVGQETLELSPDAFVGIELRRVGRKGFQMQSRETGAQLGERSRSMDLGVVQEDDDMAAQVPEEIAKEETDLLAVDVHRVQVTIEAETLSPRTHRDGRDRRNAVVAVDVSVDRRLAARAPGFLHGRDQQEARFVGKNEVGAQPCGVFFTRGHTLRFHSAIRSSSRSTARRSGFWWLHPS